MIRLTSQVFVVSNIINSQDNNIIVKVTITSTITINQQPNIKSNIMTLSHELFLIVLSSHLTRTNRVTAMRSS